MGSGDMKPIIMSYPQIYHCFVCEIDLFPVPGSKHVAGEDGKNGELMLL